MATKAEREAEARARRAETRVHVLAGHLGMETHDESLAAAAKVLRERAETAEAERAEAMARLDDVMRPIVNCDAWLASEWAGWPLARRVEFVLGYTDRARQGAYKPQWEAAEARAEMAEAEVERLQARYEAPGVRCSSGHVNIHPVSVWCCPMCTDELRADLREARADFWAAQTALTEIKLMVPLDESTDGPKSGWVGVVERVRCLAQRAERMAADTERLDSGCIRMEINVADGRQAILYRDTDLRACIDDARARTVKAAAQ